MTDAGNIRVDSLRLIFAEVAKSDILDRLKAVQSGFILLSVSVLISISAWVFRLIGSEPVAGMHIIEALIRLDSPLDFLASGFLLISGAITLLSPIVLGVLLIERRRCNKDMKDLLSLLNKYGRL